MQGWVLGLDSTAAAGVRPRCHRQEKPRSTSPPLAASHDPAWQASQLPGWGQLIVPPFDRPTVGNPPPSCLHMAAPAVAAAAALPYRHHQHHAQGLRSRVYIRHGPSDASWIWRNTLEFYIVKQNNLRQIDFADGSFWRRQHWNLNLWLPITYFQCLSNPVYSPSMRCCFLQVFFSQNNKAFFPASSIVKDIVKSNLQLNLQRNNEYYVNAKR